MDKIAILAARADAWQLAHDVMYGQSTSDPEGKSGWKFTHSLSDRLKAAQVLIATPMDWLDYDHDDLWGKTLNPSLEKIVKEQFDKEAENYILDRIKYHDDHLNIFKSRSGIKHDTEKMPAAVREKTSKALSKYSDAASEYANAIRTLKMRFEELKREGWPNKNESMHRNIHGRVVFQECFWEISHCDELKRNCREAEKIVEDKLTEGRTESRLKEMV